MSPFGTFETCGRTPNVSANCGRSEVPGALPNGAMPRRFRQEFPESEILRERALRCRQLADGVGDLKFAIKLKALSEEYEGDAKRTEAGGRVSQDFYTSHPKG